MSAQLPVRPASCLLPQEAYRKGSPLELRLLSPGSPRSGQPRSAERCRWHGNLPSFLFAQRGCATMLTADDIRTIPLFSSVAATELERLARTSADIHLAAG